MYHKNDRKGCFAVSFGVGLLVAIFCPPKITVALLAIALILLGIMSIKH